MARIELQNIAHSYFANPTGSEDFAVKELDLTWDDEADTEDGFYIYRDATPLDTIAVDNTSYSDETATPEETYEYCVQAFATEGGTSAMVCDDGTRSAVLAPTNVTATDNTFEDRVVLSWQSTATTSSGHSAWRIRLVVTQVKSSP